MRIINNSSDNMQFKLIGYRTKFDYINKRNPIVFTNIEQLLAYCNSNIYYADNKEVSCHDNFGTYYRLPFESYFEDKIQFWQLEKAPVDIKTRVISVSSLLAVPQRLNKVIFNSIDDKDLKNIPDSYINYYPYTIGEFILLLMNNQDSLNWVRYDFIAIKQH